MFWGFLIRFAVTFILGELLRPKPSIESARPSGLGDFNFPTATQGRPIPICFGRNKVTGPNMVWYGGFRYEEIAENVKTGLFSSEKVVKGFRYYVGMQFLLARNWDSTRPVILRNIYIGDEILWQGAAGSSAVPVDVDKPDFLGGDELGSGGMIGEGTFYPGGDTQLADSYIAQYQSYGGQTPAYRGNAYFVWKGGYIGNTTSMKPWAFEISRIGNPLGLATPNIGDDMNPMNAITELLIDTDWGLGQPYADINEDNFLECAATLLAEGNGFSFYWDRTMTLQDLLTEIERQVDGVLTLNRTTGKWEFSLARSGYDVDDLKQADDETVIEVQDYTEPDWADTTNEVRVRFSNRDKNYSEDYAVDQNNANFAIQGERVISELNFPGVKEASTANNLVSREIFDQSRPSCKATLVVDRTFWDTNPGDVIAWSNSKRGIVKRPMRVGEVDLGSLEQGRIVLKAVEDTFGARSGTYSDPGGLFERPTFPVVDIPSADRVLMEAPKAFIDRDTINEGVGLRIWAGARKQNGNEIAFTINVDGSNTGTVYGYLLAGELTSDLGLADHGANVSVDADPDTLEDILARVSSASDDTIGINLANIALVGDEFIAYRSVTDTDPTLRLDNVQRGLLDSAVASHSAGDRVWFISLSGGLSVDDFATGTRAVKLLPKSISTTLDAGDVTSDNVTLQNRHLRPYPPTLLELNSSLYDTTDVSIQEVVSGAPDDGKGLLAEFVRRDFRTSNEIAASVDESSLPADFPSAHSTEYRATVTSDPSGSPVELFSTAWQTNPAIAVGRTPVLSGLDGTALGTLRVSIETRHTLNSTVYTAIQTLDLDFSAVSAELANSTVVANANKDEVRELYASAPETGSYDFLVGQDDIFNALYDQLIWSDDSYHAWSDDAFLTFASGSGERLEARLNEGAWEPVIASGDTGSLSITSGDKVEIRHTGDSAGNETLLIVSNPSDDDLRHCVLVLEA